MHHSYGSFHLQNKTESSWTSPPPSKNLRFKNRSNLNHDSHHKNSRSGGGGFKKNVSGADFGDHRGKPENIAKGHEKTNMIIRVCNVNEMENMEEEVYELNQDDPVTSPTDSSSQGGVLTVASDSRTIYCPERDLTNLAEFSYNEIFPSTSKAAKIFANQIAPLTPHVARGGHACVVIDGTSASDKINVTLGHCSENQNQDEEDSEYEEQEVRQNELNITEKDLGLVHFSVNQILSHLSTMDNGGNDYHQHTDGNDTPVLTLTWYELIGRHGVRDIFASASSNSNNNTHGPTKGMKLIDDPGVGLHVPGLLEVAVRSVGDVHRILKHIRDAEDHSVFERKRRHSVLSINVKSYNGRLDLYMLSDHFIYDEDGIVETQQLSSGNNSSSESYESHSSDEDGDQEGGKNGLPLRCLWSEELFQVVYNLNNLMHQKFVPTQLFQRSNILLLLRQILLSRMPSTWLLCVEDSIDTAAVTLETLRGASDIFAMIEGHPREYRNPSKRHQINQQQTRPTRNPPSAPSSGISSLTAKTSHVHHPSSKQQHHQEQQGLPSSIVHQQQSEQQPEQQEQQQEQQQQNEDSNDSQNHNNNPGVDHTSTKAKQNKMALLAMEKLRGNKSSIQGDKLSEWLASVMHKNEISTTEMSKLKKRCSLLRKSLDRSNLLNKESALQQHSNSDASTSSHAINSDIIAQMKSRIKKLSNEIHDFNMYKDVMEVTLARMNTEMSNAIKQKDYANAMAHKMKAKLQSRKTNSDQRVGVQKIQQQVHDLNVTLQHTTAHLEKEKRHVNSLKLMIKRNEQTKNGAVEAVEMLVNEAQRVQNEMKELQEDNAALNNRVAELKEENQRLNSSTSPSSPNSNKNMNSIGKGSPKYSRSKVEELQRCVAMLEAKNVVLQRAISDNGASSQSASSSPILSAAGQKRERQMVKEHVDRTLKKYTKTNQEDEDEDSEVERVLEALEQDDDVDDKLSTTAMLKRMKAKREETQQFLAQRNQKSKFFSHLVPKSS